MERKVRDGNCLPWWRQTQGCRGPGPSRGCKEISPNRLELFLPFSCSYSLIYMDVQKNGSLKEVSGKTSHDLSAIWRMCAGRVVMPHGGLGAGWGPPPPPRAAWEQECQVLVWPQPSPGAGHRFCLSSCCLTAETMSSSFLILNTICMLTIHRFMSRA